MKKRRSLKLSTALAAAAAIVVVSSDARRAAGMSELDPRPDSLYYNLGNDAKYAGVGAVNAVFLGSPINYASGST